MTVPSPGEAKPKARNWLIIVVAVVVVFCLCSLCLVLFWYFYTYGDQIFNLSFLSTAWT